MTDKTLKFCLVFLSRDLGTAQIYSNRPGKLKEFNLAVGMHIRNLQQLSRKENGTQ